MAFEKINDRLQKVRDKIGKRTDIDQQVKEAYREAYREIAHKYPFAELETSYIDVIPGGIDELTLAETERMIRFVTVTDPSTDAKRWLKPRGLKHLTGWTGVAQGMPAVLVIEGRRLIFRPKADKAYNIEIFTRKRVLIASPIEDTQLELPEEWLVILDHLAAEQVLIDLMEYDKAQAIHILLFGGTDSNTGKRLPGLMAQRIPKRFAESEAAEYAIQPLIRRYSHVR